MAGFFQETLHELAKKKKKLAHSRARKRLSLSAADPSSDASDPSSPDDDKGVVGAEEFLDFLAKARAGEPLSNDAVVRFAKLFEDDLTLDKMGRMQLVSMAKYMGITPYGSDAFLRFQLRFKIRGLKEDDQRILWEGVNMLTKAELMEACQERGMRATGLSKAHLINSLKQWLDLSVVSQVPISLLVMSRTFFLHDETVPSESLGDLKDAISSMADDVVNEIVLEVATAEEEKKNPVIIKIKLDNLEKENEKINEEYEQRKRAEAKKEAKEREKEKEEKEEKERELTSEKEKKLALEAGNEVQSTASSAASSSASTSALKKASLELAQDSAAPSIPDGTAFTVDDTKEEGRGKEGGGGKEKARGSEVEERSVAAAAAAGDSSSSLSSFAEEAEREGESAVASGGGGEDAEEGKEEEDAAVEEKEEEGDKEEDDEEEEEDDGDVELSAAEIEALKQLVSSDPVESERSELDRIKKAIQKDDDDEEEEEEEEEEE